MLAVFRSYPVILAFSVVLVNGTGLYKCGEKEFTETRNSYEKCASLKIREITVWLEQNPENLLLSSVCGAVQDLLHTCGDELGWCFTEIQVHNSHSIQQIFPDQNKASFFLISTMALS